MKEFRVLYQFGCLLADLPEGWTEVTDDIPVPDCPITLAGADGVGALQFSAAKLLSGVIPNPSVLDLQRFLEEKAHGSEWGEPIRLETGTRSLMFAAGEYRVDVDLIRAWYLSDGRSFVFATYVCNWSERDRERIEVDSIISTLEFAEEPDFSGD